MIFNSLLFQTGTAAPEGNVMAVDNQFYFQMDKTNNIFAFWVKTSPDGIISNIGWKKIG